MDKKRIIDISLAVGLPFVLYAILFTPSFELVNELIISTGGAIKTVLIEIFQIAVILAAIIFAAKVRLADTGLYSFKPADLLKVLYGILFILGVFFAFNLIFVSLGQQNSLVVKLDTSYIILALMMLCVGYCEELFFRVYAYESFCRYINQRASAIISALLFCCGHFYEGYAAMIIIFFLGLSFQFLYKKYKSIHVIAIVHALFNVISTVISTSISSSL